MNAMSSEMIDRINGYAEKDRAMAVNLLARRGYDVGEFSTLVKQPKPQPRIAKIKEITEAKALERFSCVHRGTESIGHHVCKPCQGGREHDVFWCSLLQKGCTARASGAKHNGVAVAVCLACEDRAPQNENGNRMSATGTPEGLGGDGSLPEGSSKLGSLSGAVTYQPVGSGGSVSHLTAEIDTQTSTQPPST